MDRRKNSTGIVMQRARRITFAVLFVACSRATSAAPPCATESNDCAAVGHWNLSVGLGLGSRTNPVLGASDIPLVVVPKLSYYGKRFFLDNLDIGVALYEN